MRIRHYSIGGDLNHLVRELRLTMPTQQHGVAVKPATGRPSTGASRTFEHPSMSVRVVVGDLFEQPDQLVVGFTNTFDTDITDDRVISASAVQGQLLDKIYNGDREWLDRELDDALSACRPIAVQPSSAKRLGKLARYPLGTVAVLRPDGRRVFCCAYSEMGDDLYRVRTWSELLTCGCGRLIGVGHDHRLCVFGCCI